MVFNYNFNHLSIHFEEISVWMYSLRILCWWIKLFVYLPLNLKRWLWQFCWQNLSCSKVSVYNYQLDCLIWLESKNLFIYLNHFICFFRARKINVTKYFFINLDHVQPWNYRDKWTKKMYYYFGRENFLVTLYSCLFYAPYFGQALTSKGSI